MASLKDYYTIFTNSNLNKIKNIKFLVFCNDDIKKNISELLDIDRNSLNSYNGTCCVCVGITDTIMQIIEGKYFNIFYRIYFTICAQDDEPVKYIVYDLEDYEFYDVFFRYNPTELKITECNGYKCRQEISVCDTGIWCTSCHGEFNDDVTNLDYIMYKSIKFYNFPKKCILHIEKVETPLDLSNIDDLNNIMNTINSHKNNLDNLLYSINNWENILEKEIEEIKNKRKYEYEQNKIELNDIIKREGLNIDDCNEILNNIQNKINQINLNKKIQEKEKLIKKYESEIKIQEQSFFEKNKDLEKEKKELEEKIKLIEQEKNNLQNLTN
uniref:Uncharacterized protein n=1 Tax=Moumouvirus sp. 'Monve' TaxID=1128131 RepID=H2EEV0_9VIRU|nr:hypothetical protein mv_L718 [Moumouvirus Monve]